MGESPPVIELESQEPFPERKNHPQQEADSISSDQARDDAVEVVSPPEGKEASAVVFPALEQRPSLIRVVATFWSFLVMGLNDSAYGVSPTLVYHILRLQIR